MKRLTLLLSLPSLLMAQPYQVTGKISVVNGQNEIPRPLFGVHATPLTPERIQEWGIESDRYITQTPQRGGPRKLPSSLHHAVECQWDRYQPALIVEHADWEKRLQDAAQKAAQRVKDSPRPLVIEFWNEPYLNWGVRPGVNYDGRFYKKEGREPGAPMTLKYQQEPLEHMRWTEQTVAIHAERGHVDYLATRFMPRGKKPGDTWTWRNRPFRAEKRPWGKDVSQKTFWPGLQNVKWYVEMLKVYAPALKAADPNATLVIGWDFHIYQNSYAAWEDVHKPTFDAAAPWLDGYSEHHYGGDTRLVAASYEVAWAYMKTEHGKDIDFYNTEAGGDLDPERPGPAQPGYNTTKPEVRDRAAYTYMMRDVLHLLDKSPDKAAARAAHEAHLGKGVGTAFRMMKSLRGQLLQTVSPDPEVWIVASLQRTRMTVALYNDARGPRTLPLEVKAPTGTRITGIVKRKPNAGMQIEEEIIPWKEHPTFFKGSTRLNKREAEVWEFTLEGTPAPTPHVAIQFPAKDILKAIPKDGSYSTTISVPRNGLDAATHARLRIVQSGFTPGKHVVTVNGQQVNMKPGGQGIMDAHFPVEWLQESNTVEVKRTPGSSWCTIQSASLFLEKSM